jgi:hypothetical protein
MVLFNCLFYFKGNSMAFQKYIVELSIANTWIEDGFDIRSREDVKDLLQRLLPYAYGHEVKGRVIHAPSLKTIKKLQGVE